VYTIKKKKKNGQGPKEGCGAIDRYQGDCGMQNSKERICKILSSGKELASSCYEHGGNYSVGCLTNDELEKDM
jgi:hypothetical protein